MAEKNDIKVSLCVIALNEEDNIGTLFSNIEQQTFDHALTEIVLVDSGSTDDTKRMMVEFKENHSDFANVQVLDNPGKIQASGWNVAIKNAKGELIIRVDAHALIPHNFIAENVACIDSGEDVCGGRRVNIIKGESKGKKILLMAENSMFGSGVATYRNSDKKQYVKTVAHACYRRSVFEKVGLFNESLLRSEDNEMHYRIRQHGYKICMSDRIYSEYQTRTSLKGMLKQKWGNGKWIGITAVRKTPAIFSLYHFIPCIFALVAIACLVLFAVSFIPSVSWWLCLPFICGVALYLCIDLLLTVKSCKDYKEWTGIFVLPLLFPLLHFAYGFGTVWGIISASFVNIENVQVLGKKVSVIIPVYNTEKYLVECVESVINQSYANLEILLIDDGSKDNSGNICDELATKDKRITVCHKENGGLSSARNCGIDMATGEYLAFVDSDDIVDIDMINVLVANIEKYNSGLSGIEYSEFRDKIPNVDRNARIKYIKNDVQRYFLRKNRLYCVVRYLFRKDYLGELRFDRDIRLGEDQDFIFRYVSCIHDVTLSGYNGYFYRQNPVSLSGGRLKDNHVCDLKNRQNICQLALRKNKKVAYAHYLKGLMAFWCKGIVYGVDSEVDYIGIYAEILNKEKYSIVFSPYIELRYKVVGFMLFFGMDTTKKIIKRLLGKIWKR